MNRRSRQSVRADQCCDADTEAVTEGAEFSDYVPAKLAEALIATNAVAAWDRLDERDRQDVAAFVGPEDQDQGMRAYEIAGRLADGRPMAFRWLNFKAWVRAVLEVGP